jgi:hypothetical protein
MRRLHGVLGGICEEERRGEEKRRRGGEEERWERV